MFRDWGVDLFEHLLYAWKTSMLLGTIPILLSLTLRGDVFIQLTDKKAGLRGSGGWSPSTLTNN